MRVLRLIGVVAAAVAIPVFALGQGGSGGVDGGGNAVAIIDPGSNRVSGQMPVGSRRRASSPAPGALGREQDDKTVTHIDLASGKSSERLRSRRFAPWPRRPTRSGDDVGAARRGLPSVKIDPQFDTPGRGAVSCRALARR